MTLPGQACASRALSVLAGVHPDPSLPRYGRRVRVDYETHGWGMRGGGGRIRGLRRGSLRRWGMRGRC